MIVPYDLAKIANALCAFEKKYHKCFRGACLVALFTLLRSSNLFCSKANKHSKVTNLTIQDAGMILSLPVLKTDRFLHANISLLVPCFNFAHELCPYTAVAELPGKNATVEQHAWFSLRHKGRLKPMSSHRFTKCPQRVLRHAGRSTRNVSPHSFRKGDTTYASSLDVPADALKTQENWRSSCFQNYISHDKNLRNQFVSALVNSFRPTQDLAAK